MGHKTNNSLYFFISKAHYVKPKPPYRYMCVTSNNKCTENLIDESFYFSNTLFIFLRQGIPKYSQLGKCFKGVSQCTQETF